jgi:hypothetical protein
VLMQRRHLVAIWAPAGMLGRKAQVFGIRPSNSPVSDYIDGPQAQSCGDLDDCLPHSTVGCILDDRIPCGARKRPESSLADLQ